ncbi:MAG: hypothetical protein ACWGSQ_09610 [Longimicrobiales bacterium]
MGGINVGRWLAGGVAAGIVTFVIEGIASVFYVEEMQAALGALGLSMEMTGVVWVLTVLVSLLGGLVLVFFYAASRPRFGPGPKTAVLVAVFLWCGGYLLSLIGYYLSGIYPGGMLVKWGVVGLVEMIIAALVGGWVYREE